MSCQTPVIRSGPGSPAGRSPTAVVTYVPYDPSFEMPDEGGGPNERLTGDSIPRRVMPSRVQLAVSKPAQSPFFYSRGSFALRSVPRVRSAPIFADPSQLGGCLNGRISGWPATPWSCSGLRCALNTGSGHSVCCLIAAKNGRKPIVVTRSSIGLAIRAASLFA
jgi:hypothetical protein